MLRVTDALCLSLCCTAAILGVVGCRDGSRPDVAAAQPANLPRPHVRVGQTFSMGLLDYEIVRVSAMASMTTRGRTVNPAAGHTWVVVEYRRSWRGESVLVVPAMPFEIVTRAGANIVGDVDGLSAHMERTNCGELGPSRLRPLMDERNCEVFAVPTAQLEGLTLEPAARAHRGPFARAIVDLGALAVTPSP